MPSRTTTAILMLTAALLAAGCEDPNKRIMQLQQDLTIEQKKNDDLKLELRARNAEVETAKDQLAALNKMGPDRWELVPQAERLAIERHSGLRAGQPEMTLAAATQPGGAVPRSGEPGSAPPPNQPPGAGAAPARGQFLRLYLVAYDREGHRIEVVGPMTVLLTDASANPPRSLGELKLDARQLARYYRWALSGALYVIDLPLASPPPPAGVTAHVELTDLLTGRTLIAQELLALPKD